jgi:hypothetical protein
LLAELDVLRPERAALVGDLAGTVRGSRARPGAGGWGRGGDGGHWMQRVAGGDAPDRDFAPPAVGTVSGCIAAPAMTISAHFPKVRPAYA